MKAKPLSDVGETGQGLNTLRRIEQWEDAWANYIFALEMWETEIPGEDAIYWAGVAGRRLDEAKRQLRQLDPDLCKELGI